MNQKMSCYNNEMFEDIKNSSNWETIEKVSKGWSSDDKYMGLITGNDDVSNIPMIKKCLLTNQLISDDE